MTTGLHHITAITRDVQANVDFWMGFLGLALVKQTAGFEDARQLHLFYGDAAGSPARLSASSSGRTGRRGAWAMASRPRSRWPSRAGASATG